MGDSHADEDAPRLPKSLVKQAFDNVRSFIPEVFKEDVELKERELRAAERRLQRRFINQYRAQVELVAPVLYERGVGIGTAIRDALLGDRKATVSYDEVKYKTPGLALVDNEKTRETLKILDPLIDPVLSSFVSGVEKPLNDSLNDIKTTLGVAWIATMAGTFAIGVVVGRVYQSGKSK